MFEEAVNEIGSLNDGGEENSDLTDYEEDTSEGDSLEVNIDSEEDKEPWDKNQDDCPFCESFVIKQIRHT